MSLRDFLSKDKPESSKRLIAFLAAIVLCVATLFVVEAISYQAHKHWNVDGALVTVLTFLAGFVAVLAREIYKKPDEPGAQ